MFNLLFNFKLVGRRGLGVFFFLQVSNQDLQDYKYHISSNKLPKL